MEERRARVGELQTELAAEQEIGRQTVAGYEAKVKDLEADIQSKTKWALDVEAALTIEDRQQVILIDTDDHREAVKAFREKRAAIFRDA